MKTNNKTIKKLADLIEKNANCKFNIDNDQWYITVPNPKDENEDAVIAESDEFQTDTKWYSGGNLYGSALAEAMVELLNRRGFEIEAEAV
jgi:hypothetical protein